MALADSLADNKVSVVERLEQMRSRLAEVRGGAEARFNDFSAKSQVADALEKPSDGLREALARIKQTVGSPVAVTTSVLKPKEKIVS